MLLCAYTLGILVLFEVFERLSPSTGFAHLIITLLENFIFNIHQKVVCILSMGLVVLNILTCVP